MPPVRRWFARGLDVLAGLIVLFAIFEFFIAPRLAQTSTPPAPPVSLALLDGGKFSIDAQKGKLTYLDFWATWCEPCQQSIPLIQRFARAHPEVDVVSIDVGEPTPVVRSFVKRFPMEKVALDPDETAAHAFGVANFPTMIVIDPSGNQRAKWLGYNPDIEAQMAAAATDLLKKKTSWIAPAAAAETQRPPQLVIEDEPNSLNTIKNTPFGWQLGPLTQGYLFLVNERGELVPDRALALPTRANGGISPDGKRITYKIRTGRWSDGEPFDAHDVGYTIDALKNPNTAVPDTSAVADVVRWSVPRPDTLVVQLKQPSAPFISSFLTLGANDPFSILPHHITAKYKSLDQSSLDTEPVGLGPFKLLRWTRGERLSFVRNPYYWRGPAASERIDVRVVPDAQTRLLLARTGEIDLTEVTGFGVDIARTIPNAKIVQRTTNVVDYLQFNLHSPQLRDVAVRRAIAMAIDRKKLAAAVYRGTLVPTDYVQFDPQYWPAEKLPRYDPKAAAAILRTKHITLDFAIAGSWRNSSNVAVQISGQLQEAGVTARIRSSTEAEFWGPKDRGGVLESARYDIALTSWSPALDPDRSYLFGCNAVPPSGGNSMFFCDKAYDEAEAAGGRIYLPGSRRQYYRNAGRRLIETLPILPLGLERRTYLLAVNLLEFSGTPLGRDYWNAWRLKRL